MSDQNIKVGDRAEVVFWPCCGCELGHSMLVTRIETDKVLHLFDCAECKAVIGPPQLWTLCVDDTVPENVKLKTCPIGWLRKLPDLTEPETTETVIFDKKPETV